MLRESNVQSLHWADKTMSVIRERQLEACEDRLSAYPEYGLFSGCDDDHAEEMWDLSYDAQEHPIQTYLHTVSNLQEQVMRQLPLEAGLLTLQEHRLLEKMILYGGEVELLYPEEGSPAESLVKRMWCHLSWREEDRLFLCMPETLITEIGKIFADPAHEEMRERLIRCEAVIRALLYIDGFMGKDEPLTHLLKDVVQTDTLQAEILCQRYLRANFDYTYDQEGNMVLLHPGLADPEWAKKPMPLQAGQGFAGDQLTMLGAMSGLLPQEAPLHMQLTGLLQGAVRPEITEEEAAADLRMLAKQNVGLAEMNEVLGSLLMVQPTQEMLACVEAVQKQTPRWCGMATAVVQ